jgi:RND family efflux transporter MFP subunit
MKNKFVLNVFISFLFIGCNNSTTLENVLESDNIETLITKRKEIIESQQKIYNQLKKIDQKIEDLNKNSQLPIVETVFVKKQEFKHFVEFQGNVKSDNLITIYPEYSGILNRIYVKNGDKVSKGQKIAQIDDGGLKEQLSQLEITLELSKTTYERQERLWSQEIGSEIQYLNSKALFEAQKKGVEQLKKQLSKTTVRAPFSGTIDNIFAKEGEVVYPGSSNLMLLLNLKEMYIECNVPENYINSIVKGKEALIELPFNKELINSYVRQSGNFINSNNRTFKIEIEIPENNFNIKPNLNTKIKVNDYSNLNAILVDENVIGIDSNNDKYIYKIDKKNDEVYVDKMIVKTGKNSGKFVEIISGLNENDEIVSEGIRKLTDKTKVRIVNQ